MNLVNLASPQWCQVSRSWNTFTTATAKRLFSVQGTVNITQLFFEVTEELAGGSSVLGTFQFNPTGTGTTTTLSHASPTTSLTNAAVGRMFGITGVIGGTTGQTSGQLLPGLSSATTTAWGLVGMGSSTTLILKEGVIEFLPAFSGTMTAGKSLFRVRWEPYSSDGSVTPQA